MDRQALKWMFNITNVNKRLARWRLRLLEFDLTIKYKKGTDNIVADPISRLPTFCNSALKPDLEIPCFYISEVSEDTLHCFEIDNLIFDIDDLMLDREDASALTDQICTTTSELAAFTASATLLTEEDFLKTQFVYKECTAIR
eukprot:IDg7717t1